MKHAQNLFVWLTLGVCAYALLPENLKVLPPRVVTSTATYTYTGNCHTVDPSKAGLLITPAKPADQENLKVVLKTSKVKLPICEGAVGIQVDVKQVRYWQERLKAAGFEGQCISHCKEAKAYPSGEKR